MIFKTIIVNNLDDLIMKQATAAQKKWMSDITQFINDNGLQALYGNDYFESVKMQRHHVLGRSAKHNKIAIGHWFVIPVPYELHEPNVSHEFHVGHCKKAFVKRFGNQRDLFETMCNSMESQGYDVPPNDVFYAIMDTSV